MSFQLNFLALPLEIRDLIYGEILATKNNRQQLPNDQSRFVFDLRLFRVCKQIYHESLAVFRRNVFVCIETPFPDAPRNVVELGRVPLVAVGKHADLFEQTQMRCLVDAPEMMSPESSKFVIAGEDVAKFCTMWFYFDLTYEGINGYMRLTLTVATNPGNEVNQQLPKPIQASLLYPWARLKKLSSFHIRGPHDKEIADSVRETMATPYDSPARCIEQATRLKDEGNAALMAGNNILALECYRDAFLAIHIVVVGQRRDIWADKYFKGIIAGGPFKGQHAGLLRTTLRIRLVANTMMAYIKLENYTEAYFWGMRSINLIRESFGEAADTPPQGFLAQDMWGKIYYRTAIAAKGLGEMSEAREMLRIAAAWLPGDKLIKQDLAEWGSLRIG